jgi:autotransporter passenger strand-loop-strand repeat protein
MTTFNVPPDQINGLTLNNGDTLNVDQGGTVSGITVLHGGTLNIDGGTAVDTTLEGAFLHVSDGTVNGITFEGDGPRNNTEPPTLDELALERPGSLTSFTFGSFQNGSYMVDIVIPGITSIQSRGDTLTVNFLSELNQPPVTYHFNFPSQGPPKFTLTSHGVIQVQFEDLTSVPATGAEPPIVGVHHHHETAFMPPIVGVHHHETAFIHFGPGPH